MVKSSVGIGEKEIFVLGFEYFSKLFYCLDKTSATPLEAVSGT